MFQKPFPSTCKPVIFGCEGYELTAAEKEFFTKHQPYGFILFKRNIKNRQQVTELVKALKACVKHKEVPVLIDQEGGRVARLFAPEWEQFPPAANYMKQANDNIKQATDAIYASHQKMAQLLTELGINVNCSPVADIYFEDAHDIIGDRAFGSTVEQVVHLADAAARGLADGNVTPIMKHIPGHGRASVDSHLELPIVDTNKKQLQEQDFAVFKELSAMNNIPWAMTAHVVYSNIDNQNPATTSSKLVQMIREDIGFNGVLISDDLSMKALDGSFKERAEATLRAGCDIVLHCNGDMNEMSAVMEGIK